MHRMSHPFEKLFEKTLKKSTNDDNLVLKEATKLLEKGYKRNEVCGVLSKLEKSLIDENLETIVREAQEEVCGEDGDEDE
jgi:predicted Zn-ribbon and HTH transcriptional regulator